MPDERLPHKQDVQVDITEQVSPNIELTFYFGTHSTDTDADKFAHDLSKADVYIPECHGWDQHAVERYNNVSQGTETPHEAYRKLLLDGYADLDAPNAFRLKQWEMLYGTHKKIAFIDVPADKRESLEEDGPVIDYDQDFDTVLGQMRDYILVGAENDKRREAYMLDRLKELVDAQTEQGSKSRILVTLGAGHSNLAVAFTHASAALEQKFENTEPIYSYLTEARMKAKQGEPLDDELMARVYLADILEQYYDQVFADSTESILRVREVVSEFSKADVEAVIAAQGGTYFKLIDLMHAKGIDVSVMGKFAPKQE